MVVFLVVFVSLAFFLYGLNISMKSRSSFVFRIECCQDDSEMTVFSVFAVLNFDICCFIDSTELDEHERKVSFQ